jgi:hypothetical protein
MAGDDMPRLNLVSGCADRELDTIRRTIATFETTSGLESLVAVLHDRSVRGDRTELLDAIGHSRSHGFLVLGSWVIDDSPQTAASFGQLLRPSLEQLGVRTIRLLGCSTATTERGRNAMRRIAQATGCDVLGTKRYISQHDYGASGFVSDDTLIGPDGARPAPNDRIGFLASAAYTIPLATLELTTGPALTNDQPLLPVNEIVAGEILGFVDGSRSWVLPGLLAEVAPIVLWSEHNTIHRLEILLDCQVVRVYGVYPDDDHGRLFRVHDPDGLGRYLAALIRPRSEIRARSS